MTIRDHRHRVWRTAVFLLLAAFVCSKALAAEPKRVMLLHSFGREVKPWSDYAQSIRAELARQSPWPVDISDHSLISARSADEDPEVPFVEYLRVLFTKHPLDLIVSVGAPAAGFVQRQRQQLFAGTPMVLTVVEQRRVQYSSLTENDAVVPVRINYFAAMQNILQVLPDTRNVFVVVGKSPIEQFWRDEIRKDMSPFADRVRFTFWDNLSFEEILEQAAALPPHSAIFWELMIVDAAGVVHDGDTAFRRLHAVANAPIFGYYEPNFGQGAVGGPYNAVLDSSRAAAAVAVRILSGEKAGDIRIPPLEFAAPKFDWREMQRWGISESRLTPGTEIDFREPAAWQQYRTQIFVAFSALLIQAAVIWGLLIERHRRQAAEQLSRGRLAEIVRLNRMATLEAMSSSIGHELKQPLAAISIYAQAARRILGAESPDIAQVQEIIGDILAADQRADEITMHMRQLLKKKPEVEDQVFDINDVVESARSILSFDAKRRSVLLETEPAPGPFPVRADPIHIRQVLLNLGMNAIDAMMNWAPDKRRLVIQTTPAGSPK
jgi:signal transduction histidine kinase